jgi:hypothetical protein
VLGEFRQEHLGLVERDQHSRMMAVGSDNQSAAESLGLVVGLLDCALYKSQRLPAAAGLDQAASAAAALCPAANP